MTTPPPIPPTMLNTEEPLTREQPAPPASPLAPEIEAMIAEAESRGYLRGRNEAISNLMSSPTDTDPVLSPKDQPEDDSGVLILNTFRPSIWD